MASGPPGTEPVSSSSPDAPRGGLGRNPYIRLTAAALAAGGVVLGGPVAGSLRNALLVRWPSAYIPVLAGVVAVTGVGLVAFTVLRLRHRSWARLGAIGVALAAAVSCAAALRTGDANVDVVEAFHFTEYSALALLFAWAAVPLAHGAAWLWAGYAAVVVGTLDEWLQWFVPERTGELRDVGMNAVAVGCGLVLGAALDLGRGPLRRGQVRRLGYGGAAVAGIAGAFVATVHLGHEVRDSEVGRFVSRHTREDLLTKAGDRARAWGSGATPAPGRFGREDQYLGEALWHVRRRNQAVEHAASVTAWRENRILEKYFAPVLRVATTDGPAGHAWAPARAAAMSAGAEGAALGESDASPIPIYLWSVGDFWTGVALIGAGLVILASGVERMLARTGSENQDA